jgi:multidrug efflux pump subunit AcrB
MLVQKKIDTIFQILFSLRVGLLRVKALSESMSRAIQFAVLKPKSAIICVALVSMTGYWSLTQLTEQFFPPSDRDMFEVQLYLPTQTSIEATETLTREVNRLIHQHVGVEQVSWLVGWSQLSFVLLQSPILASRCTLLCASHGKGCRC